MNNLEMIVNTVALEGSRKNKLIIHIPLTCKSSIYDDVTRIVKLYTTDRIKILRSQNGPTFRIPLPDYYGEWMISARYKDNEIEYEVYMDRTKAALHVNLVQDHLRCVRCIITREGYVNKTIDDVKTVHSMLEDLPEWYKIKYYKEIRRYMKILSQYYYLDL